MSVFISIYPILQSVNAKMGQKKLQIETQHEYRNKENMQTLQKNMEWSNMYVKEEREWIRGDI